MKKFEPMKFNLQYFAEENETGSEDNKGADNTSGTEDTTKRNVSIDDFNNLSKSVTGLSEMMKQFMSQSQNNNNSSASNDNQSNADNSNNSSSSSSASSSSDRTSWKTVAEESKKQIEELQKRLNERDQADKANALTNYANNYAKQRGIDITGMSKNLLGEDEATTKQNIDNFEKALKANQKDSTDKGFNTSSKDFKSSKDFIDNLIAQRFPGAKTNK